MSCTLYDRRRDKGGFFLLHNIEKDEMNSRELSNNRYNPSLEGRRVYYLLRNNPSRARGR